MANITKAIISCAGQEDIVLNQKTLSLEVEFVVDTPQTKVRERKNSIVNEVTLRGKINLNTTAEIKKLAEWSLSDEYDQQYRKVEIELSEKGSDKLLRKFILPNAFCVDYREIYKRGIVKDDEENSTADLDPYFEVLLAQKADFLSEISVIAGK